MFRETVWPSSGALDCAVQLVVCCTIKVKYNGVKTSV